MGQNPIYLHNNPPFSIINFINQSDISSLFSDTASYNWIISFISDKIIYRDNGLPSKDFVQSLISCYPDSMSEMDSMNKCLDDIGITDFIYEGNIYLLNSLIRIEKVYDEELGSYYFFYDLLNLYFEDQPKEKVKTDFYEQFTYLYSFYTSKEDNQLTDDAIKLKSELLKLVKEVRRA